VEGVRRLATEAVQGTTLALEGIDDVEGGDGLALGVLGVGDGITDDRLEEGLEDTTGLFVDHCDDVSGAFQGYLVKVTTYWQRYA
jgi:hypothetical protein